MEDLKNLKCLLVQSGLFWADATANRKKLEAIANEEVVGLARELIYNNRKSGQATS